MLLIYTQHGNKLNFFNEEAVATAYLKMESNALALVASHSQS